ncbi:hypothetical protein Tco_0728004 [Tanacetum coccineum]|uniref:Xylulose kinase-1 n=1 Tax=Tanacetum coccineum TaxID=301880 RepID=A0ABQ4YMZ3_9ASTR
MANLKFYDTHNMVAYIKKIEGSEGFHQMLDFLNTSNIRYALTENPTIYVSLIQQFWQTATASTFVNGEMEITATIDGKIKIVTDASIRRQLKLEDSDGISNFPTTEIFEQLALMGSNIATAIICLATNRKFSFSKLIFDGMVKNLDNKAASTGVDVRYGGAATTITGLEAGQGSGNIEKTPTIPHDLPLLRVHTLGIDEGRMQHNELMDLVTKLLDRVVALETDLMQTKKVYGAAFTKLIKKVKRLEKKDKLSKSRRKIRLVLSDEEGLDSDIMGVSTASIDFTTANVPVTTIGAKISTASLEVKTVGDSVDDIAAESLVYIRRSAAKTKDKGKCIMEESESAMTKTKRQQEQERLGYEEALSLQEQLNEEERQRIARAHKAASSFNIEEWEDIQARIEADEELAQSYTLQQLRGYSFDEIKSLFEATMKRVNTFTPIKSDVDRIVPKIAARSTKRAAEEELGQQSSKKQKLDELSQEELQQLMIIVPEEGMNIEAPQTKYPIIEREVYTEDLRILVQERFNLTEPVEDKEMEIWVELKRLFEPDADDELWKSHKHIYDITWRLYDTCGVHLVFIKDGMDIYILVEREYPLSRGVLTQIRNKQEELFTHKEEMDLETAEITTTAKLPTLKQKNENSFKHAAKTTTNVDGTSTTIIPGPVTTEEKVQKKNDMKARSMLPMAHPNKHLMTFNQYKDAKTLFAAIQTRFGGNEATKKTQMNLLKQMYENFSDLSIESLDSIFNRL